jgi:predicted secreted protein
MEEQQRNAEYCLRVDVLTAVNAIQIMVFWDVLLHVLPKEGRTIQKSPEVEPWFL